MEKEPPKHGFLALFISLMLLIVVFPIFQQTMHAKIFYEAFLSLVLIFSLYTLISSLWIFILGLLLLLPALTFGWWIYFSYSIPLQALNHTFNLLFFLFTITLLLTRVYRKKKIDKDTIFGAISIYILIGIAWTQIYGLIDLCVPHSFSENFGGNRSFSSLVLQAETFIYYSFTTLTTLGYGDITAISPPARFFSILEALVGQIFIATKIARAISVYSLQR